MDKNIEIILRVAAVYFYVLFLTRLMGRKAIAQFTFFDFVTAISMGTITGSTMLGSPPGVTAGVIVLISISLLTVLTGYLSTKSRWIQRVLNAEPLLIIKNGNIVKENMGKGRYPIEDLMMQLREKNVFNIADVEFAYLEHDGKLSVLPKSQKQPVTPSDLSIPTSYKGVVTELIMDGEVMEDNLLSVNLGMDWLMGELKKRDISSPQDVFLCTLDTEGQIYIAKKRQ